MAKKSSSTKSSIPKVIVDKDSSVGVRKIENGFIVSESGSTGKGRSMQYYNKEYFSKTNPLKIGGGGNGNGSAPMKFGKK